MANHKCPYCDKKHNCNYDCDNDCILDYMASCNDCFDKGLTEGDKKVKKSKIFVTDDGSLAVYISLDKDDNPLDITFDEDKAKAPYAVRYVKI